jgi:hypothetical protein
VGTVLAILDALKGLIGLVVLAVGMFLATGPAWMMVAVGGILVASAATDRPRS